MIVGVPKEIKDKENRVAITPAGARTMVEAGHTVLVEQNAGAGSDFSDDEYVSGGTEVVKTAAEVFERVLNFLGLPQWRPARFGNRFPGNYTEKMSDATRRRLVDYFAPHNAKLYAHLGTQFDWDR